MQVEVHKFNAQIKKRAFATSASVLRNTARAPQSYTSIDCLNYPGNAVLSVNVKRMKQIESVMNAKLSNECDAQSRARREAGATVATRFSA